MIEHRGVTLIGRHEPQTEDNRALRVLTDPYRDRARRAWRGRWPDRADDWDKWDVQAMVGSFGSWVFVDFLCFDGFGRTHAPVLTGRFRYIAALDTINPLLAPENPSVLHESWRLLPPEGHPHAKHAYRQHWIERLRTLEGRLERLGLFDHPESTTRDGWAAVLKRYRLVIREDGYGRFHIEEPKVEASAL